MPVRTPLRSQVGFPLAALLLLIGSVALVLRFAIVASTVVRDPEVSTSDKVGWMILGMICGAIIALASSYIQPLRWRMRLLVLCCGAVVGPIFALMPLSPLWTQEGPSIRFVLSVCAGSIAIVILGLVLRSPNP